VPNTDFKRPYRLETYITSIDWIEKRTGIEFMPRLSDKERLTLAATVATMWP
jgi:DNA/RNA endonuclease G (NUC1)